VLSACAPSYHGFANTEYSQSSYGYSHTEYGYSETQAQTFAAQSRYGEAGLRPACDVQINSCGFMAVVPVYPVYQIVTAPPAVEEPPLIVIQDPVPEPPVIVLPPDPEPPVYVPPAPEHWPTPETPIKPWTPPRK